MAEREREKKNQELKIKRRDYTGYDDDEFAPGQAGMKRAVLAKYDEFLEGSKETVSVVRRSEVQVSDWRPYRGFALAALHQRSAKAKMSKHQCRSIRRYSQSTMPVRVPLLHMHAEC